MVRKQYAFGNQPVTCRNRWLACTSCIPEIKWIHNIASTVVTCYFNHIALEYICYWSVILRKPCYFLHTTCMFRTSIFHMGALYFWNPIGLWHPHQVIDRVLRLHFFWIFLPCLSCVGGTRLVSQFSHHTCHIWERLFWIQICFSCWWYMVAIMMRYHYFWHPWHITNTILCFQCCRYVAQLLLKRDFQLTCWQHHSNAP